LRVEPSAVEYHGTCHVEERRMSEELRRCRRFRRSDAAFALLLLLALWPGMAAGQETIRIGLPTKTFWPTVVTEAAIRQKVFANEGIKVEPTIYRGGAECFEALAAGAADLILDPPALVATGRKKGVMSKLVAAGGMEASGWFLMVRADSKSTTPAELSGKKVGITSAGSGSDVLAQWTMQDQKISFTRVPLGGGGLVPNLLAGNVDAIVLYSPLSFQLIKSKEARSITDYAQAVPRNLNSGWIATDKLIADRPQLVQKSLNALFGGLQYLRRDRDAAIKLISEIDEIPGDVASEEYEHTILRLEVNGGMTQDSISRALDLARMGGMQDMAPVEEIFTTQFIPIPKQP